jgi:RNA polymerase sigma factor (sigma-70 family)
MADGGGFDMAACLASVRDGDEAAARGLVEELWPLVIKIVRSHLPRRTAEEDLAQEIFLKIFSRLAQYQARDGKPSAHWVSRVAVTTCLDALRAEKRRPEWRFADLGEQEAMWLEHMTADESDEAPIDGLAAREVVTKLMQTLSPDDRLVINLLDLEQRSVREIGELTGWGASKVKVKAFRARKRLRKVADQMTAEGKL